MSEHRRCGGRFHWSGPKGIELPFGCLSSVRSAPHTLAPLLQGERVMQNDTQTLPHPRLHLRASVLLPLAELDPALPLPRLCRIGPWRQRTADRAIERVTVAPTIAPP